MKKAVINFKNNNGQCLKWAVIVVLQHENINSFMMEAVIIQKPVQVCRANQWTSFYMITTSVMKTLASSQGNELATEL